jgi:hypothetical protein
MQFSTPSITPAQVVALVTAALATAVQFGVQISAAKQHVILADVALVVAIVFGDAVVRHGRAVGNANRGS